jgi:outer membrane protein assembly factor BamB
MARQSRALTPSGRRLILSLLVLLALALVAALAGGVTLWQRLHAPMYQHTPNAINTGKSILYLSSPGFAPAPTLLTMVRTSDGATLWHYSLDGTLSSGFAPTIGEALALGQAVEVANGVVYFVDDPNHLGGPNRVQELMALRAEDGTVLWRQPVQGALVELFGASDGVVCSVSPSSEALWWSRRHCLATTPGPAPSPGNDKAATSPARRVPSGRHSLCHGRRRLRFIVADRPCAPGTHGTNALAVYTGAPAWHAWRAVQRLSCRRREWSRYPLR